MDIKEIRRHNLRLIQKLFDTQEALASRLGMAPAQLWALQAEPDKKSARPMGDKVARKIEAVMRLPRGSMDSIILLDEGTSLENMRNVIEEDRGQYLLGASEGGDPRAAGKVPLISRVMAGSSALAIDNLEPGDAEEWLYCNTRHSNSTYALTVTGDSMTQAFGNSYPDGSIIFVDPERRGGVVNGDPIIAKINGEDAVTFKCLAIDGDRVFLKPLNPQYPAIFQEFRVLGKVIEKLERTN